MGLNGGYCCFWWEKPAALGFLRAQDECTGLPPSRLGGGPLSLFPPLWVERTFLATAHPKILDLFTVLKAEPQGTLALPAILEGEFTSLQPLPITS